MQAGGRQTDYFNIISTYSLALKEINILLRKEEAAEIHTDVNFAFCLWDQNLPLT